MFLSSLDRCRNERRRSNITYWPTWIQCDGGTAMRWFWKYQGMRMQEWTNLLHECVLVVWRPGVWKTSIRFNPAIVQMVQHGNLRKVLHQIPTMLNLRSLAVLLHLVLGMLRWQTVHFEKECSRISSMKNKYQLLYANENQFR